MAKKSKKKLLEPQAISSLQKFEMRIMARADMLFADYNPREIDDESKRRLRENLKRVGLLEPIIVNEQTGNIVSGHQRIAELDVLEGSDGYALEVAIINVDLKREKEICIWLNNPLGQGTYDPLKLGDALHGISFKNCGFESTELMAIVPTFAAPVEPLPPEPASTKPPLDVILVFENRAENDRFMELIKLPTTEKYVAGELVAAVLGQTLTT